MSVILSEPEQAKTGLNLGRWSDGTPQWPSDSSPDYLGYYSPEYRLLPPSIIG
jgi:hypothetical protein